LIPAAERTRLAAVAARGAYRATDLTCRRSAAVTGRRSAHLHESPLEVAADKALTRKRDDHTLYRVIDTRCVDTRGPKEASVPDGEALDPIVGDITDSVLVERQLRHGVDRLTLNRPDTLNALVAPEGFVYLEKVLQETAERDDVKVIVLRGAGRSLSSGDDLRRTPFEAFGGVPGQKLSQSKRVVGIQRTSRLFYTMSFLPKPLIVQAHGPVVAGGVILCMCADLVIGSESSTYSRKEQRIGFGGHDPFANLLSVLHLGPKRAREFLLTGRTIDSAKALDWGLINEVVPDEQLEERTLEWAEAISIHPMDGLVIGKQHHLDTLECLGLHKDWHSGSISHPLFTNLVYGEQDWNFLSRRGKLGSSETFKERERLWAEKGF
jgi:enoyl-CoA hydratase